MNTSTCNYRIESVSTEEEAARVAEFLSSEFSFDDDRYTPGELQQFQTIPYRAVAGEYFLYFVRTESGEIVGVSCFQENEQKSGGYFWDYLVVHKKYRSQGIARLLYRAMLETLQAVGARYIVTYTCSLDSYRPIRDMFDRLGFKLVGCCPDYYYEGEDRLIYYRKL